MNEYMNERGVEEKRGTNECTHEWHKCVNVYGNLSKREYQVTLLPSATFILGSTMSCHVFPSHVNVSSPFYFPASSLSSLAPSRPLLLFFPCFPFFPFFRPSSVSFPGTTVPPPGEGASLPASPGRQARARARPPGGEAGRVEEAVRHPPPLFVAIRHNKGRAKISSPRRMRRTTSWRTSWRKWRGRKQRRRRWHLWPCWHLPARSR